MHKRILTLGILFLFVCSAFIPMSLGFNVRITDTIEQPSILSRGKTLYVGGSGPDNYTKIKHAIYDAVDGDTVFVYKNRYQELLNIDKNISLIGEDKHTTLIDGYVKGTCIKIIGANNVVINNFTIYRCKYSYPDNFNNVIYAENCNNLLIYDNIINLHLYSGPSGIGNAGVCLKDSSNNIIHSNIIKDVELFQYTRGVHIIGESDNNKVFGNEIFTLWSGVMIRAGEYTNEIFNNYIHNCYIGVTLESDENIISNNTIIQNHWTGIDVDEADYNKIKNNSILENGGWIGCKGGIYISGSSFNIISDNQIIDNIPTGIYIGVDYPSGDNNIITKNYISNSSGTGIYCSSDGGDYISYNYIFNQPYGVVFYYSDNNHVTNNLISHNAEVGVYAYYGYNNLISRNNFIDNGKEAYFEAVEPWKNKNQWNENYWNRPRILPYLIFGKVNFLIFFYYPWINIDWRPAKEPYDIGV